MTYDRLTTLFALIAGIAEILIEFEYLEKRVGGVVLGISLFLWGFLTNKSQKKAENKWKRK